MVSAVVESLAALVLGNPTHEETPASGDANFQRKRVSMADDQPVANKRRLVGPEVEEPCRAPEESESKDRAVLALSTVVDKAVKSDDAPAPVHLFDLRVLDAFLLWLKGPSIKAEGDSWIGERLLTGFAASVSVCGIEG